MKKEFGPSFSVSMYACGFVPMVMVLQVLGNPFTGISL